MRARYVIFWRIAMSFWFAICAMPCFDSSPCHFDLLLVPYAIATFCFFFTAQISCSACSTWWMHTWLNGWEKRLHNAGHDGPTNSEVIVWVWKCWRETAKAFKIPFIMFPRSGRSEFGIGFWLWTSDSIVYTFNTWPCQSLGLSDDWSVGRFLHHSERFLHLWPYPILPCPIPFRF